MSSLKRIVKLESRLADTRVEINKFRKEFISSVGNIGDKIQELYQRIEMVKYNQRLLAEVLSKKGFISNDDILSLDKEILGEDLATLNHKLNRIKFEDDGVVIDGAKYVKAMHGTEEAHDDSVAEDKA